MSDLANPTELHDVFAFGDILIQRLEETLTDGSKVYDIVITQGDDAVALHCLDYGRAINLAALLSNAIAQNVVG